MTDYTQISLEEARRRYLADSTISMPIAGFLSWSAFAIALFLFGDRLPSYAAFIAAAIPFPLAMLIDKIRGEPGLSVESRENPITQLFLQFISVVALMIPFVVFAANAAGDLDLFILGIAILAGLVWVPHGWGADDRAGFIHFAMRALLCYAAYWFAPQELRAAAIAGAAALTYVYAIIAMRKPGSVR